MTEESPITAKDEPVSSPETNSDITAAEIEPLTDNDSPPAPETKDNRKSGGFWGCMTDLFLVALLAGALGGGGWYLYREMERYRVPSQMELAMEENLALSRTRDGLRDAAFHADHRQQRSYGFRKICPDIRLEFFIDHLFHHILVGTDAVFCKEGVSHIDHRVFCQKFLTE